MAHSLRRAGPWWLAAALLGLATASCTAKNVIGTVEGEPVCADFKLGPDTLMKGSLKKPVRVSIMDGDDVVWERVLLGKRAASDAASKFVVEDNDEEYTVRWAQCPNIFAPRRVEGESRTQDLGLSYDCGEAEKYEETELVVKAADAASRVLNWVAPFDAACWSAPAEPASSASASTSADADDSPPDAGADASPDASASAASSASAAPAVSAKPASKPAAPKPPAPKPPAPKAPLPKAPVPKAPLPKPPVPPPAPPAAPAAPQTPPPSGI